MVPERVEARIPKSQLVRVGPAHSAATAMTASGRNRRPWPRSVRGDGAAVPAARAERVAARPEAPSASRRRWQQHQPRSAPSGTGRPHPGSPARAPGASARSRSRPAAPVRPPSREAHVAGSAPPRQRSGGDDDSERERRRGRTGPRLRLRWNPMTGRRVMSLLALAVAGSAAGWVRSGQRVPSDAPATSCRWSRARASCLQVLRMRQRARTRSARWSWWSIERGYRSSDGAAAPSTSRLLKLGWSGADARHGDEHAADSPGHKLRLTYATAVGDLQGIDLGWIHRPRTIALALSRAIFVARADHVDAARARGFLAVCASLERQTAVRTDGHVPAPPSRSRRSSPTSSRRQPESVRTSGSGSPRRAAATICSSSDATRSARRRAPPPARARAAAPRPARSAAHRRARSVRAAPRGGSAPPRVRGRSPRGCASPRRRMPEGGCRGSARARARSEG